MTTLSTSRVGPRTPLRPVLILSKLPPLQGYQLGEGPREKVMVPCTDVHGKIRME